MEKRNIRFNLKVKQHKSRPIYFSEQNHPYPQQNNETSAAMQYIFIVVKIVKRMLLFLYNAKSTSLN